MSKPLPDYANPPLFEVALSVQLAPLEALNAVRVGQLWQAFRERLPKLEEHTPIEGVIELPDPAGPPATPRLQFVRAGQVPARVWFVSETGNELVQVQRDRFVSNWRKVTGHESYPRYEAVRREFVRGFTELQTFSHNEGLGDIVPLQCEVTYVNHIETNGQRPTAARILSVFNSQYSDSFLGTPEQVSLDMSFPILREETFLGRLRVSLQPGLLPSGDQIYRLVLIARGAPIGDKKDVTKAVLAFLDRGREEIVRAFSSLTTEEMHREWGRRA